MSNENNEKTTNIETIDVKRQIERDLARGITIEMLEKDIEERRKRLLQQADDKNFKNNQDKGEDKSD